MSAKYQLHSHALSWSIAKYTTDVPLATDNKKKFKIKAITEIKESLNATKSKLDDEFKKRDFSRYWSQCDPFKSEKYIVSKVGQTFNVSNAWLKCFEIIMSYKLVDHITDEKKSTFLHFDNAAFPGSFVIATHHLVNTLFQQWAGKYVWKASSLIEKNKLNSDPLEDKYALYENYRNHWLMHEKNNGDVLVESNQKDFCEQLGNRVDLYTSDLGFDVSSDYNNQEYLQMPANIGQILTGLLTLRKGGCLITKQYTIFEPTTIAVMYATASFFDEFFIHKPYTSREANSETYLVGKGFKGGVYFDHPYIKAMMSIATGQAPKEISFIDASLYPKEYLSTIVKAARELARVQSDKINSDIERSNNAIKKGNYVFDEYQKNIAPTIIEWYKLCPILPIEKILNMKDSFRQAR